MFVNFLNKRQTESFTFNSINSVRLIAKQDTT